MAKRKQSMLAATELADVARFLKQHCRYLRGRVLANQNDLEHLEFLMLEVVKHCEELAEADDG